MRLRQAIASKKLGWGEVPVTAEPRTSATLFCLEDLVAAYEEGRPTLGHVALAHHLTEACFAVAESHLWRQRVMLPVKNRDLYISHR